MKQFKLLSYLLVAVLSLGFPSCSDDDDPTFEDSEVLGTWTVTRVKGYVTNEDGDRVNGDQTIESGLWVYHFNEDGTGYEDLDDEIDNFDWTLKNGNKLVLDYDYYEPVTHKISSLNNSACTIVNKGEDDNGPYSLTLTLKKIN